MGEIVAEHRLEGVERCLDGLEAECGVAGTKLCFKTVSRSRSALLAALGDDLAHDPVGP